ncbi:hypothetical protein CPC08DRAFT_313612 [Agrocybe pediades]|nr:hypothetical protein CPC08DRAFT_313612 [Agrocybe pediades]
MSRESSASLEIVPPGSSRPKSLADVMDSAFKHNHKTTVEDSKDYDDADGEAEVDEIEERLVAPPPPPSKPVPPVVATQPAAEEPSPDAPTPCERCVRTNKPCKGKANARCDYCKRLKQKCSNSSGSARSKNTPKKATETHGTPKNAAKRTAGDPSQPSGSLKRKSPGRDPVPNGDIDGHSMDGEGSIVDEDHPDLTAARPTKKRRPSKGTSRVQVQKAVHELEGHLKRLKEFAAKEEQKLNSILDTLNAQLGQMDED